MFTFFFQPDVRFNPGSLRVLAAAALPGSSRSGVGAQPVPEGAQPVHGADARATEPGTSRERPVFVGESPPAKKAKVEIVTLLSYV